MTICGALPPITLVPGDSWEETVNIKDQAGEPIDLTGWDIDYAEIRRRGLDAIVNLDDGTLALDLSALGEGKIRFTASAENTGRGLSMGDLYELEIEGVSPAGQRRTLYFGRVIFSPIFTTNDITVFHVGFQGVPGLNAYQVAVAHGFEGTVEEWLESLIGWTPVLAVVADGERHVHRIVDWIGSGEDKPATGLYIGATGLVADIADGVNIRGGIGLTGDAATIEVDSVTTLEPEQPATVVNTGTSGAAKLAYGIPRGRTGDQGPAGAPGEPLLCIVQEVGGVFAGLYPITRYYHGTAHFDHLYAEVLVGAGSVDAAIRVNGVIVHGPVTVAAGSPFDADDLDLELETGDRAELIVYPPTGEVIYLTAQLDGSA